LENGDATDLLRDTRQVIWQGQSANFTNASSPTGEPWPLRKYHGHAILDNGRGGIPGHPLLIDTGDLYQSLIGGEHHTESMQGRTVETGTKLFYAEYHEFGDGVPQRAFIGIGEEFLANIENVMGKWVQSIFAGAA
jgi:phage gpG-like protein